MYLQEKTRNNESIQIENSEKYNQQQQLRFYICRQDKKCDYVKLQNTNKCDQAIQL